MRFRHAAGAVAELQSEILGRLHSSPTADKPDLLLLHVLDKQNSQSNTKPIKFCQLMSLIMKENSLKSYVNSKACCCLLVSLDIKWWKPQASKPGPGPHWRCPCRHL